MPIAVEEQRKIKKRMQFGVRKLQVKFNKCLYSTCYTNTRSSVTYPHGYLLFNPMKDGGVEREADSCKRRHGIQNQPRQKEPVFAILPGGDHNKNGNKYRYKRADY